MSVPEQYVDRLSGEHARRNSVSAVAVEAFVNHAGKTELRRDARLGLAALSS
jgi:hypothetical protein